MNKGVRRQIKRACRARVAGQLGRCVGAQVLYTLPFVLLAVILYVAVFGRTFVLAAAGYIDEYTQAAMLMEDMTSSTVWAILLITIAVSGPLHYGMMRFYIRLQRGGEPPVSTLFGPFTAIDPLWAGVRMGFCLFVRSFLWQLLPAAILSIGLVGTVFYLLTLPYPVPYGQQMPGGFFIAVLLYLLAMLLVQVRLLAYRAGWIVMDDREDCGAWAATRDAARAFKGHYRQLLVFMFSFLGWDVLLYAGGYLCVYLGVYGMNLIGGEMGVAVLVMASIAALCLVVLLGAFLTAYINTSFIGLYTYYSTLPEEDGEPPRDGGDMLEADGQPAADRGAVAEGDAEEDGGAEES